MKFLADENYLPSLISFLQKNFHDVKRVQRSLKGISDESVVSKSQKENRIILTFDKDLLKYPQIKVIVFDFPNTITDEILFTMDQFLIDLKRFTKKKNFTLIFSKKGLEEK